MTEFLDPIFVISIFSCTYIGTLIMLEIREEEKRQEDSVYLIKNID